MTVARRALRTGAGMSATTTATAGGTDTHPLASLKSLLLWSVIALSRANGDVRL